MFIEMQKDDNILIQKMGRFLWMATIMLVIGFWFAFPEASWDEDGDWSDNFCNTCYKLGKFDEIPREQLMYAIPGEFMDEYKSILLEECKKEGCRM